MTEKEGALMRTARGVKGQEETLDFKSKRLRMYVPVTGFDAAAACRSVRTDTEIYQSCRMGFSLTVHTSNCLLSYLNEDIPQTTYL